MDDGSVIGFAPPVRAIAIQALIFPQLCIAGTAGKIRRWHFLVEKVCQIEILVVDKLPQIVILAL